MTDYVKDLHVAIFTGRVSYGKCHFVLDLKEKEYNKYFD